MEGGARRSRRPAIPERPTPPPQPPPGTRKVPVVYYLCRSRQLDHPHFIEVPLSSPDGLHLRDVIAQLNVLRGHGMPTMYSWSCKRRYRNGFVWHDLAADDFISPAANGGEYVLKGSELLGQSSAGYISYSTNSYELKPPYIYTPMPVSDRPRPPVLSRTREAWTQTEDVELEQRRRSPSLCLSEDADNGGSSSPVRRTNTLESLIRADACRMNNYEILGRDEFLVPMKGKLKSVSVLMNLITCGSFPTKKHHRLGPVWAYNPRFSDMKFASPVLASSVILGELDFLGEHPNVMEMKQEERSC